MTALSKFAPHALALSLALAFPMAQAASTVAASGSLQDNGIGGSFGGTVKDLSFSQVATGSGFSKEIVGFRDDGLPWDNRITVKADSAGDGRFGSSIVIDRLYGSASTINTGVTSTFASSLTNSTSSSQTAAFALKIDALSFDIDWGSADGLNRASFSAMVYANGGSTPVWSSQFSLTANSGFNAGFASITETGTSLGLSSAVSAACSGSTSECGSLFTRTSFAIGGYTQTLNFDVAAGETLNLRYVVSLNSETNTYGGASSVVFADPAGFAGTGGSASLSFATPVPEPESVALMAAGLALVAAAKRRAQRRAKV